MAGACPNHMCGIKVGMQAIMYCQMEDEIDFWWVKPCRDDANELEQNTLNRHANGTFKNTPGRSKALLGSLAQKFSGVRNGDFTFGIDRSGRAFIDEVDGDGRTN